MCAIYGYISSRSVDVGIFQQCLAHRGPDGSGVYRDDNNHLTLGHSRLSIIDLSAVADQPMLDESEHFALVFNGEIYNYQGNTLGARGGRLPLQDTFGYRSIAACLQVLR